MPSESKRNTARIPNRPVPSRVSSPPFIREYWHLFALLLSVVLGFAAWGVRVDLKFASHLSRLWHTSRGDAAFESAVLAGDDRTRPWLLRKAARHYELVQHLAEETPGGWRLLQRLGEAYAGLAGEASRNYPLRLNLAGKAFYYGELLQRAEVVFRRASAAAKEEKAAAEELRSLSLVHARVLLSLREPAAALEVLKSVPRESTGPEGFRLKAEAHSQLGRYRAAAGYFNRFFAVSEGVSVVEGARVKALRAEAELEEAYRVRGTDRRGFEAHVAEARKLAREANNVAARLVLARVDLATGKAGRAIVELESLPAERGGILRAAQYVLARALVVAEKREEAAAGLERLAGAEDGIGTAALLALAEMELDAGRAEAAATRMFSLRPTSWPRSVAPVHLTEVDRVLDPGAAGALAERIAHKLLVAHQAKEAAGLYARLLDYPGIDRVHYGILCADALVALAEACPPGRADDDRDERTEILGTAAARYILAAQESQRMPPGSPGEKKRAADAAWKAAEIADGIGMPAPAADAFELFRAVAPENDRRFPVVSLRLGLSLADLGLYAQSIETLNNLVTSTLTAPPGVLRLAHLALADVLAFSAVVESASAGRVEAGGVTAERPEHLGRLEQARLIYRDLVKEAQAAAAPEVRDAMLGYGVTLCIMADAFDAGDEPEKAAKYYKAAAIMLARGLAETESAESKEAGELREKLLRSSAVSALRDEAHARFHLARACYATGESGKAAEGMKRALPFLPGYLLPEAHGYLVLARCAAAARSESSADWGTAWEEVQKARRVMSSEADAAWLDGMEKLCVRGKRGGESVPGELTEGEEL